MNCLYFALRQIFPELKDNLLRNVNGKNKIKSNEVSNFLKNTYIFCNPEILAYNSVCIYHAVELLMILLLF